MMSAADFRLHSPATLRNREHILAFLARLLGDSTTILEIASGSGEHAAFLASRLGAAISWWPSDPDPAARRSIAAWAEEVPNVRLPALDLDMTKAEPAALPCRPDAMVCINMIHIAPWSAAEGLFRNAESWLPPASPLYLYGPFLLADKPTAPSNEAFDRSLRQQNPAWGLRELDRVAALAKRHGFVLEETAPMPANNLSVIFRKRAG